MLSEAPTGVWLKILPKHDDDDSVYFATGKKWEEILPCLVKAKLITFSNRSGQLAANRDMWQQFRTHFPKIEIDGTRTKRTKSHQYFICVGTPKFKKPALQL